MKKAIEKINNFFIVVLLFIFYFVVVGAAYLIYKAINRRRLGKKSYWEKPPDKDLRLGYFESAY